MNQQKKFNFLKAHSRNIKP